MNVCIFTSVSDGTPWAADTLPNRAEYCLRHGYSLLVRHQHYQHALRCQDELAALLDRFDLVWTLDADCIVTNTRQRIEDVAAGRHVTVCEEGIVDRNRLNCGSMVWRNTPQTRTVLAAIKQSEPEWANPSFHAYSWQSWLAAKADLLGDWLTIMPQRSFNSVEWDWGGGGCHWQPGDFVYHPCGVEHGSRSAILRERLLEVVG